MSASTETTVTLAEAKALIRCLAHAESCLLLSTPGLGKSDAIRQAAAEAGLVCRSLLGTQIAPEDVGGVPKVVRQRSIFCPPRVVFPEDGRPFCLFLDELPAAPPDVQKAFYSLLLERRVGEYHLPKGSWVVAAGNHTQDRALSKALSTALINRLFILPIRADVAGWLAWAEANAVRAEVRAFIQYVPQSLCRPVPREPVPFSTPRSWTMLARDLDLAERDGENSAEERRALAFGRVSAEDAGLFCALYEDGLANLRPIPEYLRDPTLLPMRGTALWFVVSRLRKAVERNELKPAGAGDEFPGQVNALLAALPQEYRFAVLVDQVRPWAEYGANDAMLETLKEVTGL